MPHKQEEQKADAYQQQQQTATNTAIAGAGPDPYVEAAKTHAAGELTGIGHGDLSGIDEVNNINNAASRVRSMSRTKIGDEKLANYASDPNYVAQLGDYNKRVFDASVGDATIGAVEDARNYDTNLLLQGGAQGLQARQGQAGMDVSTLPVAQQAVQFSRRPSFWQNLAMAAVAGGSQVAGAYAGNH